MTAIEDARAALAEGRDAYTYRDLRQVLESLVTEHERLSVPDGWFVFGSHAGFDTPVEFSEELDETGMPRWERPRTTTPPTADEREALARVIATAFNQGRDYTDAILGSDVWRNRRQTPIPTVEEYKATLAGVRARQSAKGYTPEHDDEHGIRHILIWAVDYARRGRSDDSAGMIVAALELLDRQGPITDAQMEAAARVFYESQTGRDGLATSTYREHWLAMARRALEAAREA